MIFMVSVILFLLRVCVGTVGINGVSTLRSLLQRIFLSQICVYQAFMSWSPVTNQSLISPGLCVTQAHLITCVLMGMWRVCKGVTHLQAYRER